MQLEPFDAGLAGVPDDATHHTVGPVARATGAEAMTVRPDNRSPESVNMRGKVNLESISCP